MSNNSLLKDAHLCHISLASLSRWLEENDLWGKDFSEDKKEWVKKLENNFFSFFVDTRLLLINKDVVFLEVAEENTVKFLAKTYQINEQKICQKLFGENKHIILLTNQQWKALNEKEKEKKGNCIILFKSEESIKSNLARWLEIFSPIKELI